jgi:protein-disulfide isomerase
MGFAFVLWLLINALFVDRLRKVTWVLLLVYFFAAIGFSWYYIYIMIYEVDYLCTWCMVVHAVNFLSLGIVIYTAIKSRRGFLYPEISAWPERIYFVTAALVIPLAVYSSSMMVEKWLSFDDIKIKYEELANDPVVIMALLKTSPTFEVEVTPGDPIFGDPDAQYPIFFFSDFQCPICPRTEEYLKSLVSLNPGLLKLVYKNYPLSNECNPTLLGNLHPLGCKAARAAYAAYLLGGSKAFWDYSDLLFQNQKKLKNEPWIEFAEMLKLDTKKFQTLLQEDSEAARKVLSDIDLGITLKLSATPQVFFQGKNIPQTFKGEYLIDAMEELIKANDPGKKDFSLRRR